MTESGRKCSDWLKSLSAYVEDTETPRHFWLWGGLFTLAAALQRKVWLPFGLEPLYPNLYIMLVAPPGKCRKGASLGLAKKMLVETNVPVSVDSLTKRALTKEMAQIAKESIFHWQGKPKVHCSIAIVSKELASLLAVDPKAMVDCLTDLYDSHDAWKYATSGEGHDFLYGVCVSCFLGTTPGWISENLPDLVIGGGLSSRIVIVTGSEKYKRVTVPSVPSESLYSDLLHDLTIISNLVGEFQWGEGAYDLFDQWYQTRIDAYYKEIKDERIHSFIERIHIMVLKAAMALHVSRSSELVLERDDIGRSIEILGDVLVTAGSAFAGYGRSSTSTDVERLIGQIRIAKVVTSRELLQMNYRNTNRTELAEVLGTIEGMGLIRTLGWEEGVATYEWVGTPVGEGKKQNEVS